MCGVGRRARDVPHERGATFPRKRGRRLRAVTIKNDVQLGPRRRHATVRFPYCALLTYGGAAACAAAARHARAGARQLRWVGEGVCRLGSIDVDLRRPVTPDPAAAPGSDVPAETRSGRGAAADARGRRGRPKVCIRCKSTGGRRGTCIECTPRERSLQLVRGNGVRCIECAVCARTATRSAARRRVLPPRDDGLHPSRHRRGPLLGAPGHPHTPRVRVPYL
jgi:hypothetical protein